MGEMELKVGLRLQVELQTDCRELLDRWVDGIGGGWELRRIDGWDCGCDRSIGMVGGGGSKQLQAC